MAMKLPTITTPTYEFVLPSTGKQYSYRPYLAKEEKILLIAKESGDLKQMLNAINEVVRNCVDGMDVAATELPIFDLKYIFLQLRIKSSGETVSPIIECKGCKKNFTTTIDLDQIDVIKSEKPHNAVVELTDSVGVKLRYPTAAMTIKFELAEDKIEAQFGLLVDSIESVIDGDAVIPASETSREELVTFVDSLSGKLMNKMKEQFFDTIPELKYIKKLECKHCKEETTISAESLQDFFI